MNGLEPDAKAIERATRQLTTELKPLDDRLTQVPWLSGNVYGVADIVAASYVWTLAPLSYDLGRWQGLSNWWSRVERRPAFQSVASLYAA